MFEIIVEKEGMTFLGWREVPVQPEFLEESSRMHAMIIQGFMQNQQMLKKDLILTVNYILQEKYLNRVMIILM